ncbi:hypothetical protein PLICRDRAFT_180784 [Plicaturopsis crispa FD-325 SS-3]|uniref:Uncharacterized protein n=1 Tax=Plicaturopsis crispa FD-325 SS-3 TaxID=944288 RepID=A0A0C9SK37_PLICR|nr:hypothetical protein PLICRDRAFT_180784 [Plicaturopsis crispa FD-325 SS-3]
MHIGTLRPSAQSQRADTTQSPTCQRHLCPRTHERRRPPNVHRRRIPPAALASATSTPPCTPPSAHPRILNARRPLRAGIALASMFCIGGALRAPMSQQPGSCPPRKGSAKARRPRARAPSPSPSALAPRLACTPTTCTLASQLPASSRPQPWHCAPLHIERRHVPYACRRMSDTHNRPRFFNVHAGPHSDGACPSQV